MPVSVDERLVNADWTKQTRDVDLKPGEVRPFDKAQAEAERKLRLNRPVRKPSGKD